MSLRVSVQLSTSMRPPPPERTTHLHQRILYPSSSNPPPRVLHSPAHAALDPLLLDLISLICREHVLSWYSSISPDRTFIQQVASIIIHVVQALEVRLANVDLVELLVLDLPALLERHVEDWEQADAKARTGHAHNLDRDNVFHLLQPHIAVNLVPLPVSGILEPKVDKTYLRALVDNLLQLLLPPEDYRAETERTIVREIIVNIILGNVFDKVAQPWFLHQIIAKLVEGENDKAEVRRSGSSQGVDDTAPSSFSPPSSSFAVVLDKGLATLASLPTLFRAITTSISALYHTAVASPVPPSYQHQPPLTTPILSLLTTLLPPSTLLAQSFHYLHLPLAFFSSFVTSLVFYIVNEKLLNAELVKTVLEVATRSLFPNCHPPPKEDDPDYDGKEELRRRCEAGVARVLPGEQRPLRIAFLADEDSSAEAMANALKPEVPPTERPLALSRHLLRPISSHVANVHLFVLVLDLVIGKLFPELVVGVEE